MYPPFSRQNQPEKGEKLITFRNFPGFANTMLIIHHYLLFVIQVPYFQVPFYSVYIFSHNVSTIPIPPKQPKHFSTVKRKTHSYYK